MTRRRVAVAVAVTLLLSVAPASAATARASRPCRQPAAQAAAQKYLDALQDRHAAWRVPFDPYVVRYENGALTGFTAAELRLDLFLHLQLSIVQGVEHVRWTYQPDGRADVINATYHSDVGLPGAIVAGTTIDEDFTLTPSCRLKVVDAVFTVEQPG